MKNLESEKPLIFLGDHHGAWNMLFDIIRLKDIRDCYIISVGDLGIGFHKKEKEQKQTENLNNFFKQKNINFYGIRGNHDDPSYFSGENRICLDNFELIEDYTMSEYGDKSIQFIGGAISVDRTGRNIGTSYWENEGVVFNREACKKVDILVTHTAPSHCFPQQFNEMVYGWAGQDAYLIQDLTDERAVMDEIFKACNPSSHLYGHFHSTWSEEINGCRHRSLNINEFFEYR